MFYDLMVLRKKNKITQKDLAKELNIPKSSYSKKERGECNFTIRQAKIIADYFNKTIEEVFFPNENPKKILKIYKLKNEIRNLNRRV